MTLSCATVLYSSLQLYPPSLFLHVKHLSEAAFTVRSGSWVSGRQGCSYAEDAAGRVSPGASQVPPDRLIPCRSASVTTGGTWQDAYVWFRRNTEESGFFPFTTSRLFIFFSSAVMWFATMDLNECHKKSSFYCLFFTAAIAFYHTKHL